jgi:hypothetical protein
LPGILTGDPRHIGATNARIGRRKVRSDWRGEHDLVGIAHRHYVCVGADLTKGVLSKLRAVEAAAFAVGLLTNGRDIAAVVRRGKGLQHGKGRLNEQAGGENEVNHAAGVTAEAASGGKLRERYLSKGHSERETQ